MTETTTDSAVLTTRGGKSNKSGQFYSAFAWAQAAEKKLLAMGFAARATRTCPDGTDDEQFPDDVAYVVTTRAGLTAIGK